jgi:trk system potassium uptake protein TrkA
MKVIVCGAGQVGTGIAERLAAEGNDVSVIDSDPELVDRVNELLEVRAIVGNGAHPDVLERAGAREAEMLIAVTLHDEVNMLACQVAHALFTVPTKIARVRAQTYLDPKWSKLYSTKSMGIDVVISPEKEVGDQVLRRLALPGAFESLSFGDGRIVVVGILCAEDCPVVDTPLRQLADLFPDLPSVVMAVVRSGRLFAPHSDDQLLVGDDVFVATPVEQVARTLEIFGKEIAQTRRVVIAGGGNIGLYLARVLEESQPNIRVKLIEASRPRSEIVAQQLGRTVVLNGSALSEDLLHEADISSADMLVAVTNDDQVNLLASVLAKQLGCQRSVALINSTSYSSILRGFGIDAHLNPKSITVSRVLQYMRRGRVRAVHSFHNGAGEIIEMEVLDTSPIIGKSLADLQLPEGVRFGAVLRDGRALAPDGRFELEPRDRVVMFATAERVREIQQLFRVSVEFF